VPTPAPLTDHVQKGLLYAFPLRETTCPVVPGTASVLGDEGVLGVEQALEVRVLDTMDHP